MATKGKRRRVGWSDDFKRRVLAEVAASDQSASAIARRHGLNPNLVFNWRKKFGGGAPSAALPEPKLLPVEIKVDESAESVTEDLPPSMLEIMLPCGSQLRCGSGMDPALLGQALVALRPGALDSDG